MEVLTFITDFIVAFIMLNLVVGLFNYKHNQRIVSFYQSVSPEKRNASKN